MNSQEIDYQYHLAQAKKYYSDAPESVWDIQEVKNRVPKWNDAGRRGLVGTTFGGYKFKYHGVNCIIS